MSFNRRKMLGAGLGSALGLTHLATATGAASSAGAGAGAGAGTGAGRRELGNGAAAMRGVGIAADAFGVYPDTGKVVSVRLQHAIDAAAARGLPLWLAPGVYKAADLAVRPGTQLVGVAGRTVLEFSGGRSFLLAADAAHIRVEGLILDGANRPMDVSRATGLLMADSCRRLHLREIEVRRALLNGLSLRRSSGRITQCTISQVGDCGIFSIDASGLEISHNHVTDCGNNGIQVWRSDPGEDGSLIVCNRIKGIAARAGGSGQNGNGINVYRAGSVQVEGNRITQCAYSAVRGNAASNIQIMSNSCERLGEVALYAEFGFEGAMIANNLIEMAATGIAATNFNKGGRLALIQGNLIRNLKRREFEPHDKRGTGIAVEADTLVTGNVIESAETSGIMVGWGEYMRDVTVTSNLIRNARLGIGVSSDPNTGTCILAHNMISGSSIGAIRAMNYATPIGADLAGRDGRSGRLRLAGNIAV